MITAVKEISIPPYTNLAVKHRDPLRSFQAYIECCIVLQSSFIQQSVQMNPLPVTSCPVKTVLLLQRAHVLHPRTYNMCSVCLWLISLSIASPSFDHVITNAKGSFFLKANRPSHMYISLWSSLIGHLGLSSILAMRNTLH